MSPVDDISSSTSVNTDRENYYCKWNADKTSEYVNIISSEDFICQINSLETLLNTSNLNESDIDTNVNAFTNMLENISIPLFGHKTKTCNDNTNYHNSMHTDEKYIKDNKRAPKENVKMYNDICSEEKRVFYRALNDYRNHSNEENKKTLIETRKLYKQKVRIFNYEKCKDNTSKLLNARHKNVKLY